VKRSACPPQLDVSLRCRDSGVGGRLVLADESFGLPTMGESNFSLERPVGMRSGMVRTRDTWV